MTKLFKWLSGTATAALVGALMFGAAGAFSASEAEAQSPPSPPARFGGEVTIDGEQASAGTSVQATVDGNNCGTTSVESGGTYVVDVEAAEPTNSPGCGEEGATVVFIVDGNEANETGEWIDYEFNELNLSVTTQEDDTPTPTPEDEDPTATPDDGDEDPTPTPDDGDDVDPTSTPEGPDTGTGIAADGGGTSATVLFGVVLLGTLAFGAAGMAAARRS